ncbi:MAG: ribosome silencing factor [Terriglobales bacterium]
MATRKKQSELKQQVAAAFTACQEKKAERISILQLDKAHGGFTDYFLICSGSNPRQIQAISDEVEQRLSKTTGARPAHIEGYTQAEWVLLDYVDFVVHVFSEKARQFYDLERLWKSAKRLELSDLKSGVTRKRAVTPRPAASPRKTRARKTPAS